MRQNLVKLGYLLGISLVLAGILYFFASNWQGFDRYTKIALSMAMMLLFYGSGFVSRMLLPHQAFLSHWLLVASSISFGLSTALVGQIYNSHADGYWLFFIWLLPAVLFSVFTKYQPFYVLSFILLQLTMYFYISPTAVFHRTENEEIFLYLTMAFINALIFLFVKKQYVKSPIVMYGAFIVIHFIFLSISQPNYTVLSVSILIAYIALSIVSLFYFSKVQSHKGLLGISIVAAALLVVQQVLWYLFDNYSELTLFLVLGFVFLFVAASVWFINWLSHHTNAQQKSLRVIKQIIIIGITAIASILGSISIGGLVTLFTGEYSQNFMMLIGTAIMLSFFFIKAAVPTVKYTLFMTGFLISGVSAFFVYDALFFIYFVLFVSLLWFAKQKSLRAAIYTLAQLLILIKLPTTYYEAIQLDYVLIALILLNVIVCCLTACLPFKRSSLLLTFIFSLSLIGSVNSPTLNITYSILFFAFSTAFLFKSVRKDKKFEFTASIIFWFIFLGTQYYDYLWDLLDKSFALLLLGALFTACSYKFDLVEKQHPSFIEQHKKRIVFIIALQLMILGGLFMKNEILLQSGKEVKLELAPLDPRSLLQGDYVELHYEISDIELEKVKDGQRVQLLLRKNKQGVFEYAKQYKIHDKWNSPYQAKKGDVLITGTYYSWGIQYGIEHYFIPEGTGLQIEQEAKHAKVKVGKNGDAILVEVTP
ncbi:GDYXXLXY domain-containing protein [Priestia flexa]|nr:GDYXXLXY domain-containing protein [Priestia flexa]WHX77425.1 GDYXXLXY domain-containing protein [Priestia flexa]